MSTTVKVGSCLPLGDRHLQYTIHKNTMNKHTVTTHTDIIIFKICEAGGGRSKANANLTDLKNHDKF